MGPAPALIARYRRTHPQVSAAERDEPGCADRGAARTSHRPQHLAHAGRRRGAAIAAFVAGSGGGGARPGIAWRRKRLALADLAREPFVVLRQDTSAYARWLAEACAREASCPMWRRAWRSAGPAGAGGGGAGRGAGAGIRLSPDGRPHRGVRAARRAVAAMVYAVTRRRGRRRALDQFRRPPQGGPRRGLAEHAVQRLRPQPDAEGAQLVAAEHVDRDAVAGAVCASSSSSPAGASTRRPMATSTSPADSRPCGRRRLPAPWPAPTCRPACAMRTSSVGMLAAVFHSRMPCGSSSSASTSAVPRRGAR